MWGRQSLLLLALGALGVGACSSDNPAVGPCSQHDDCAENSFCVQDQCVTACSSDDDCESPLSCEPHPDLPNDTSACFVTAGDGDETGAPLGGRDGGSSTGGADTAAGTGATGGVASGGTEGTEGMVATGGLQGIGGWSSGDPQPCDLDEGGLGGQGGAPGSGVEGPDSTFAMDGIGTSGSWEGYLYSFSAPASEVSPNCFVGEQVCVHGTMAGGYTEWVNVGWNIAQDVDPETFEGGDIHAISPGADGVRVETANLAGSGLRVQIQTDPEASEFWCAPMPASGSGVLLWEDFTKECWVPGGEPYDGVSPISQIAVQSYAGSGTLPTPFHYCLIDIAPYVHSEDSK